MLHLAEPQIGIAEIAPKQASRRVGCVTHIQSPCCEEVNQPAQPVAATQAPALTADAGRYRARDLLLLPTLLSALRLPLALAVWLFPQRPIVVLGLLVAAGISDVLDGWLARRWRQATPLGAVVDGVADKVFAMAVVATLVVHYELSLFGALALAAREIVEAPLVVWWMFHRHRRHARASTPKANWLGKLATVIQFAAVVAVVKGELTTTLLSLSAAAAVLSALAYWRRELNAV